jgi:hypothetical protein
MMLYEIGSWIEVKNRVVSTELVPVNILGMETCGGSRESLGDVLIGLWAGRPRNRGSTPM